MRRLASLLLPGLLLACSGDGTADLEARLDATWVRLPELAAEARQAVGEATGVDLEDLPVVAVGTEDVARSLASNLGVDSPLIEEPALEEDQRSTGGLEGIARALMGIYDIEREEVRVCRENLLWLADLLEEPGLLREDVLYAVLAHECAHAAADRRFGLQGFVSSREGRDAQRGANAVLEGHAQRVARRVCAAAGREAGFELMTRAMGMIPETGDASQELVARIMAEAFASAYRDGEAFLDAVVAARGEEEGLAVAFADPPAGQTLLEHPEWYLDPASRPAPAYDLDAGLAVLEEYFAEEIPEFTHAEIGRGELLVAASPLGEEEAGKAADLVETAQAVVGMPDPDSQVMAVLLVCQDEAAARAFLDYEERIGRAKDEQMARGMIRIEEARYEDLPGTPRPGFLMYKTVNAAGTTVEVVVLCQVRGELLLELTLVGMEVQRQDLLDLGAKILDRAVDEAVAAESD